MVEFTGTETVSSNVTNVWNFLSDIEKVGKCVPGIKKIEVVNQDSFNAEVEIAVGFIKNTYRVNATFVEKMPPQSAKLKIEGSGGGGHMNGEADVSLSGANNTTTISYKVNVTVAGPVAGLGSRFINGAAEKIFKGLFGCVKSSLETS
jgi:carbon monoxide dehydrogenase subunit G